ncbi:MAG: response regulator [Granulosicoccus sp.]|nr:response regulator [Granulosicoccus sp.]
MSKRLLLVEQSATMRYVLEKYGESLGFTVDTCETYPDAQRSLNDQYKQFGAEYTGLLFGWPTTPQDDAAEFAQQLESNDYKDLPVVVMSTDMRAETRAWVAGRDNTAVLPWKEYQGLEAMLQRLIDVAPDDDGDAFSVKFDNSDVHLLVVDDSATIRYSLRDLFQMQGYKVTLAATQEEAMRYAEETAFDIAVLDFYLTETTGDVLCRELMANEKVGDIVCTVLTGTYSDHIIKRSLRAGAVECMFKNESSELLLSRIDAISRFVRQQRILQSDQYLLEEVIDCVAGAVLIINSSNQIVYINEAGLDELDVRSKELIIGLTSDKLFEANGPGSVDVDLHSAQWNKPDGRSVAIDYQHKVIQPSGYSLIRFTRSAVAIDHADVQVLQQDESSQAVAQSAIRQLSLASESEGLLVQMQEYLNKADKEATLVSLLIMDVFVKDPSEESLNLTSDHPLYNEVRESMYGIYKKPSHVALLLDNRYAFLLRHKEEAQAYILVRKIMQRCLQLSDKGQNDSADNTSENKEENSQLACTGSLLSLSQNSNQAVNVLMQHAFKGMDLVNNHGKNQALLMDLRRLLSVYPK